MVTAACGVGQRISGKSAARKLQLAGVLKVKVQITLVLGTGTSIVSFVLSLQPEGQ